MLDEDTIIKRCVERHGDLYDYSDIKYTGISYKIRVVCKEHGEFWVLPQNHYRKSNPVICPKCGVRNNMVKDTKKLIDTCKSLYGDLFDYSKTKWNGSSNKITVICKHHGEFTVNAQQHYRGDNGCKICKKNKFDRTMEEKKDGKLKSFVDKSNSIHNNKYTYDKFVYINAKSKSIITCKMHGDFLQSVNQHIRGRGCPKCKQSRGECKIEEILTKYNVKYEREKWFRDCVGIGSKVKKPLEFDFYLPGYNTILEFDGLQHYKHGNGWNTEENHSKTKMRDKIKNEYCKNKNICLVRIPYWLYGDIENIILQVIQVPNM